MEKLNESNEGGKILVKILRKYFCLSDLKYLVYFGQKHFFIIGEVFFSWKEIILIV